MTKIERGKDGRAAFVWTVQFKVSQTWVEDGFDLDDERALDMLSHDIGYAHIGTELDSKVIDAPNPRLIRKAQGYKD